MVDRRTDTVGKEREKVRGSERSPPRTSTSWLGQLNLRNHFFRLPFARCSLSLDGAFFSIFIFCPPPPPPALPLVLSLDSSILHSSDSILVAGFMRRWFNSPFFIYMEHMHRVHAETRIGPEQISLDGAFYNCFFFSIFLPTVPG